MSVERLIDRLQRQGYRFSLDGERVFIRPELTEDALQLLREHKPEVVRVLQRKRRFGKAAPDTLEELRKYCPKLFDVVRLQDGREGLLWGVTARGLIVSFDPSGVLYTVDP
ncbi:MAG: hypothetical protein ACR2HJ_12745 [Fimbriimonadales bacterium]